MKRCLAIVGAGLWMSVFGSVEVQAYSFERVCAREIATLCKHATYYQIPDCLMKFERYLNFECVRAMRQYNFNNQAWYPEARYQWINYKTAERGNPYW